MNNQTYYLPDGRAVELIEKLNNGEDFAELAKSVSEDPGSAIQGGDLGEVRRGVMVPAFEEAVYAQIKDEVGQPVKTRFGFHIIRVDDIQASVKKPYEEVKEEIRDDYVSNQAREKFDSNLDEMTNMAFENPDSLDPIVDALSLEIKASGLFTRVSGSGIADNADVRGAAFSPEVLSEGNNSGALEVSESKMIVLRIKDHEEARDKTLDEASAEIESLLITQKTEAALDEAQAAIVDALESGAGVEVTANEYKGTFESTEGVTRTERKGLDQSLIQAAFEIAQKDDSVATATAIVAGSNRAIIVLKSVKDGSLVELEEAEKDRLQEQALGAVGNGDFSSLLNTLRKDADVFINPQLTAAQQ